MKTPPIERATASPNAAVAAVEDAEEEGGAGGIERAAAAGAVAGEAGVGVEGTGAGAEAGAECAVESDVKALYEMCS